MRVSLNGSTCSAESLFQHLQFKAGERVYRVGQVLDTLYIVSCGFLKTMMLDEFGNEQVLGFPMKGDLLGTDGIDSRTYQSEAIALSDCDLILLPFRELIALGRAYPEIESFLHCMMSRELVRQQAVIGVLGTLPAEARVARFLTSLAGRFVDMGYSGKVFNLRMTRQDIGSYLGLTLETVSRTLSAFNEIGLITVRQRAIRINDAQRLKTLRRLPPLETQTRRAAVKRANWTRTAGHTLHGH